MSWFSFCIIRSFHFLTSVAVCAPREVIVLALFADPSIIRELETILFFFLSRLILSRCFNFLWLYLFSGRSCARLITNTLLLSFSVCASFCRLIFVFLPLNWALVDSISFHKFLFFRLSLLILSNRTGCFRSNSFLYFFRLSTRSLNLWFLDELFAKAI